MRTRAAHKFSRVKGREVVSAVGRKLWRCSTCAWWREWTDLHCCGCGAARDVPDENDVSIPCVASEMSNSRAAADRRPVTGTPRKGLSVNAA